MRYRGGCQRRRVTTSEDSLASPPTPSAETDGRSLGSGVVLPRGLVVLLGVAAIVIAAAGARSIAWLIGPVFLALVLVIALAPVHGRLRNRGWPGWAATLVLALSVYAVVVSIALGIIVSIGQLATTLPQYAAQSRDLVSSASSTLTRFGVSPEELRKVVDSLDLGKLVQVVGSVLADVAGLASNLIFLLTLLLFLTIENVTVPKRVGRIAVDRPLVAGALRSFAHNTRQYLLVSTVFGLIVAALDTIALFVMGIPLAVTWGVLAFVTNYIPNVGFIIGLVPPALLALLTGGPGLMVAVIAVYGVLNFVIQSLLQPRFVGDAVGLSVTVTFLSLVFWAWLLGPLGAVLAIPLTLLAKALLIDIDPRATWADALISHEDVEKEKRRPHREGRGAGVSGRWHRRHRPEGGPTDDEAVQA
ncbi:AI-2E family transporter [Pseudonocardia sp. D17]|nr:AI-2E family transporter [Pseudonocardia sp. D17]